MTATVSFTSAESALVSTLIANIDALTADNCKAGDRDGVANYALANSDVHYWAWTDYLGGDNLGRGVWQHLALLTVGIFFRDGATQMDADIRAMVDDVYGMLLPDDTLGGAVNSCSILEAQAFQVEENVENGLKYVLLMFRLSLEEMMPTGSNR